MASRVSITLYLCLSYSDLQVRESVQMRMRATLIDPPLFCFFGLIAFFPSQGILFLRRVMSIPPSSPWNLMA
jgi:hypothetical protein